MSYSEIILIALALSIDALVCSVITGKSARTHSNYLTTGLIVALSFGFFQFIMPLVGFWGGQQLQEQIAAFDHYVAFALLALVSANMLKEAFTQESESKKNQDSPLAISLLSLIAMAVGTSIDALAVGVSYGLLETSIMLCAVIIGLICTICSLGGFFLGTFLSTLERLDRMLNVLGALVLFAIGIKILIEHQAWPF